MIAERAPPAESDSRTPPSLDRCGADPAIPGACRPASAAAATGDVHRPSPRLDAMAALLMGAIALVAWVVVQLGGGALLMRPLGNP